MYATLQDPVEQNHVRMQQLLLDAVRQNAVSPVFLNLLGLLNLVVQHSSDNGSTLQVCVGVSVWV